ncbi:MAG: hypothetical protein RQ867_10455 [Mariprofundaceae bacterium]|nr:hypothetical protein [Mariprofundaceae bacterium]
MNFYTSFIRYPLHMLRGHSKESFQWVSGVPLLGTLLVIISLLLLREHALFFWSGMVLLLIDTGGPLWFAGSLLYRRLRRLAGPGSTDA